MLWDRVPLVPVTVTVKVPLLGELHDRVEVPDPPVTLVGVRVQVRPPVGDTVAVSATVPVNPLTVGNDAVTPSISVSIMVARAPLTA